jgi:hypothetical protein
VAGVLHATWTQGPARRVPRKARPLS